MALEIKDLGVKFYASKTKAEALALATLPGDAAEPGAICFVSDNTGNYIIVDGRIFGDGASGGGGTSGGGDVYSVNGKTGAVVIELGDLSVISQNGTTLKTLQDYFQADGTIISESFKIQKEIIDENNNSTYVDIITIDDNGIHIGQDEVATQNFVTLKVTENNTLILNQANQQAQNIADVAEQNAKDYADRVLASIYKVKGSVDSYTDLLQIQDPKTGDVYNVKGSQGTIGTESYIPPGTNYVYIEISDRTDSNYPGYWDALGGSINLSNYFNKVEVNQLILETLQSANQYTDNVRSNLESSISTINTNIQTINSRSLQNQVDIQTVNNKVTTNTTNITQNTTNISNLANQLTWQ